MKIYFYLLLVFIASSIIINSNQKEDSTSNIVTNVNFNNETYKNVPNKINSILNKYKLSTTKYAISIYSANMKKNIYTHNPQTPLVPASNTKLVTTFTTFNLLNDNPNVKTKIAIEGNINNGELNGNLYIIGGGDALLSVNDLENIADEIKSFGINKVNGNIIGDDSFFDNAYYRVNYSNDKDEVEPTPPITALALEKNVVNVIITAGNKTGKPVNVSFKPNSSAFVTNNAAIIQRKGKKTRNNIKISSNIDSNGKQIFYIKGTLEPNRTYSYKIYIKNPALATAAALKDRLISAGIAVTGNATKINQNKTQNLPEQIQNNQIKTIYSFNRNVNELINIANKQSNNYIAETLFKLNGAIINKNPNTAKSSQIATTQILNQNQINADNLLFNDGSGLSRRNLITSNALLEIIIKATHSTFANEFTNSLSIAGIDGTLAKRMRNSNAENNLKAKTGTLRNVSSLAGLTKNQFNDTIYFALIFNGGSVGTYKQIENEICTMLAE